jgi:hypothetical protein
MLSETTTRARQTGTQETSGLTTRCRDAAEAALDDYPLTTTIGAFAVGLTLGVLAGAAMARPFHTHERHTAESLGRRILDAVRDYVPQSVNQYLPG